MNLNYLEPLMWRGGIINGEVYLSFYLACIVAALYMMD